MGTKLNANGITRGLAGGLKDKVRTGRMAEPSALAARSVVFVAHPLFRTARRCDKLVLSIRYDVELDHLVAYPAEAPIEPMYIPALCNWVELNATEKQVLSKAARYNWSDEDYSHFEAAVNRAILLLAWKEKLPEKRYLKGKLLELRKAALLLDAALGDYSSAPEGHRAIVSSNILLRRFIEKSFPDPDAFGEMDEVVTECNAAIAGLDVFEVEKGAGRSADVGLQELLREVLIIVMSAGISTTLPSNSIGELLAKSTPLSAVALEVCRIVSVKGMLYLNGKSKTQIGSNLRQRQNLMRDYHSKSEASLVKRLRTILKEERDRGGSFASLCSIISIDSQLASSGDFIRMSFDHESKSWKTEGL